MTQELEDDPDVGIEMDQVPVPPDDWDEHFGGDSPIAVP
jgi:hypothetical protein